MKARKMSGNVVLALMTSLFALSACEETRNNWTGEPMPTYGQNPDSTAIINGTVYYGFYTNGNIHWYYIRTGFNGHYYHHCSSDVNSHRTVVYASRGESSHIAGFGNIGHGVPARSIAS